MAFQRLSPLIAALGIAMFSGSLAHGQNNNNNNNNNNNVGGILVDADGLLSGLAVRDQKNPLERKRRQAFAKDQPAADWRTASECRFVSLNRLEAAYASAQADNGNVPPEIWHLAGLWRIDYLFVVPETQDLILAGPAEDCVPDAGGRAVGVLSGRPALRVDDFGVVWRTLKETRQIGCSIDTDPERLAALKQFLAQNSTPATLGVVRQRYQQMTEIVGFQHVRVFGVPADSHVAAAMVEADWRLKRIALGVDNPGVPGLKSFLTMVQPGASAMQRWYFVPLYDSLVKSADGQSYQFAGSRVQAMAEDEFVRDDGQRIPAPTTQRSNSGFAKQLTQKYHELAARQLAFAELQSVMDWVLVCAVIQRHQLAQKVGWEAAVFSDETRAPYVKSQPPTKVGSIYTTKPAGASIMGLISGGVTINVRELLSSESWRDETNERLESQRQRSVSAARPPGHSWWWD